LGKICCKNYKFLEKLFYNICIIKNTRKSKKGKEIGIMAVAIVAVLIAGTLIGTTLFSDSPVKNLDDIFKNVEKVVKEIEKVEKIVEPSAKWVSLVNFNYDEAGDRISFSFALADADQNYIAKAGKANIKFIDDSGKTFHTVQVDFEKDDFVKLKIPLSGVTYLAYYGHIPHEKLLQSKDSFVDAFVDLILDDGTKFNIESSLYLG